jgi:ATP-binding cassette, subfamily C, bacterial
LNSTDRAGRWHLPVADGRTARTALRHLVSADRRAVAGALALSALASVAGLGAPFLLGEIVNAVKDRAGIGRIDRLALLILALAFAYLFLTRFARLGCYRAGERTLAKLREQFVDRVLELPPQTVERAGTGDLMTRSTSDIETLGGTLREAGPDVLMAVIQVLFIVVAVLALSPALGASGLLGLSGIWFAARWYLARARPAYLSELAADSAVAEVLATTAEGARTVESLGLQYARRDAAAQAITTAREAAMRTLFLRSVLFPAVEFSYAVPVAVTLFVGALLYDQSWVSLGAVVAVTLYMWQLVSPLDTVLTWLDQLQLSGAALARVVGVLRTGPATAPTVKPPADDLINVEGVCYSYVEGRDILHGITMDVRPGERLAIIGPTGAGKSTLGRLLAGLERPRRGQVTAGGIPLCELDPATLRRQVVLITQEHHVFLGTLRDNLTMAAPGTGDTELAAALTIVGADWAGELPQGLDTEVGPQGHRLDDAQAQQVALARVVLANPHTLVLDEATSLLDPNTARKTERTLAAVLSGRSVIAIAHRLHTARDADRIVVLTDGQVSEAGTHDELVAAGGVYAALWKSWQRPGS